MNQRKKHSDFSIIIINKATSQEVALLLNTGITVVKKLLVFHKTDP
jgi:hypothetical protein